MENPPMYLPRAPTPEEFGRNIWDTMILVALGYPDNASNEDMNRYRLYYYFQGNVLPCPKCAFNFNLHLLKYPLDNNVFESRQSLLKWIKDLKNEVNKNIGKDEITDEAFSDYINNMYGSEIVPRQNRYSIDPQSLTESYRDPYKKRITEPFTNTEENSWIIAIIIVIIIIIIYVLYKNKGK